MTGSAVRGDAGLTGRSAGEARELTMSTKTEIRRVVRRGSRKCCDFLTRKPGSIGETQMTCRACLARIVYMVLQSMAAETLPYYRVPYSHPWLSGLIVTCGAVLNQRAVCNVSSRCGLVMRLVCEAEITRMRTGSRLPRHLPLYHAIMTRLAAHWIREERFTRVQNSSVTCRAERENSGMLFVRKAISSNKIRKR